MSSARHEEPGPRADARDPEATDARTAALVDAVRRHGGAPCSACVRVLCPHAVVLSALLGFGRAPRCAECLARETGERASALSARVLAWLRARDCYRAAWEFASALEGSGDALRPACLFPAAGAAPASAAADLAPSEHADAFLPSDGTFDAGDLACGELVLELRQRLAPLPAGSVLRVRALDPAAPVDLPAWCGLTGHRLLSARPPLYWIERKESPPS